MKKDRKLFKEMRRRIRNQAKIVCNIQDREMRIKREYNKEIKDLKARYRWTFLRRLKYLLTCR